MYQSILVPIDLDQPGSWAKAVPTAIALCRCFDAALAFTTVVSENGLAIEAPWSSSAYRERIDRAHARLASLASSITDLPAECHVETGGVHEGILAVAERIGADLIILSSHRPELKDILLGANASRVMRHARCSVFVVRD